MTIAEVASTVGSISGAVSLGWIIFQWGRGSSGSRPENPYSETIASTFVLAACLLTGCAQMGTRQTDRNTTTRYEIDKAGKTNSITTEVRETTTRAKGTAVISGKTALEGFAANQDGKKQGLEIKKTSQQTEGLAQAIESLKALRDIGAMMYGLPPAQEQKPSTQKLQNQ